VTYVNEVIVIFVQLILFANTAAIFYSLLGLVSRSFLRTRQRWENYQEMVLLRRGQSLTRCLACFKNRWPTNRLFVPMCYPKSFLLCL